MSVGAVLAVIYGLKDIAQDGVGWLPLAVIAAGLAVGVLFVRRQRMLADPMIDVGLFRIGAFNTALAINFLAIFVAVGYFLFVAQYLQLVVGLSRSRPGRGRCRRRSGSSSARSWRRESCTRSGPRS
jgi:MFS transporter, DHA2 family, multidrug resistance protein